MKKILIIFLLMIPVLSFSQDKSTVVLRLQQQTAFLYNFHLMELGVQKPKIYHGKLLIDKYSTKDSWMGQPSSKDWYKSYISRAKAVGQLILNLDMKSFRVYFIYQNGYYETYLIY